MNSSSSSSTSTSSSSANNNNRNNNNNNNNNNRRDSTNNNSPKTAFNFNFNDSFQAVGKVFDDFQDNIKDSLDEISSKC